MNELTISDDEKIENMIYVIRGKEVMFANDVAKLYNSETKIINQVVKRNRNRFPEDFCFRLNEEEIVLCSRSQNVTLNKSENKRGFNLKYLPYVFTEHGIMMLSSLLKSDIAASVNVTIINAFVSMRKYISNDLLEQKYINNQVMKNALDIKLLQDSFAEFQKKKVTNEIYFEGQIYDSYSKLIDIMNEAKNNLIIIDAYADKTVLDMIAKLKVKVILIVKIKSLLKEIDINKYNQQYNNLKIKYNDTFHDRYIIIDKKIIYHCGTSLNYAGTKTFSINKLEDNYVIEALLNKVTEILN